VGHGETPSPPTDHIAWEQAYQFMCELRARGPATGQARAWRREDLYEERVKRYGPDSG
jgi:hypothetical protein